MKFDPTTLRAAYDFLRTAAFRDDARLPAGKHIRFICRALKVHGYHDYVRKRHTIWIDSTDTKSVNDMLRIMAHEMIHVARKDIGASDADAHDELFRQAARVVEQEMGWSKGSV